jgi:hypothetical protein
MAATAKLNLTSDPMPLFSIFSLVAILVKIGITGHNFGRGLSKDDSTKVWLQLTQWFLRRFLCEFHPPFF